MVWQAPHTTNTFSMCELMSHVLDNQPLVFITPNMTILVVWTMSLLYNGVKMKFLAPNKHDCRTKVKFDYSGAYSLKVNEK